MSKIFSLGSLSYTILYPLFLSFLCFGYNISKEALQLKIRNIEFFTIVLFINDTLARLIFGIITLISNKCFSKKSKIKENKINYKKFILFILIISIALILEFVSLHYSRPIEQKEEEKTKDNQKKDYQFLSLFKILQLIITMIVCIFLFKNQLYRHHYISGGSALFFVIIMTIIDCTCNDNKYTTKIILLSLLAYLLISIDAILEKMIMQNLSVKPFTVLFFEGIFLFGFLLFFIIIIVSCSFNVFNFSLLWTNIGWFFLILILNIALLFTKIQTLFYYSPAHRFSVDILLLFYTYIFKLARGNNTNLVVIIFDGILYALIIISLLIFHEIIIIHIFNMDENTKNSIEGRSENEKMQIITEIDEISAINNERE